MFPSPKSGVSFKHFKVTLEPENAVEKFPSPKSGVSFKHVVLYTVCLVGWVFPSPKSGVSFKPCALEPASLLG